MADPIVFLDTAKSSHERCMASEGFIDDFYLEFLSSSPQVAEKFANTNLLQQKILLGQAIDLLLRFYHAPAPDIAQKMAEISEAHAKSSLDIEPELYELWLSALLRAVAKHDSDYSQDVDNAWQNVVNHGIAAMIAAYDD